jgi:transposase
MILLQLFLSLFRFCVFLLSRRSATAKIALLRFENQYYRRYFTQRRIRPDLLPYEKQAVHEFACRTKNSSRFFSPASPAAVLFLWKNAVARRWNYLRRKRKPGRPPLANAVKNLMVKLKRENYLWGARRIRDELKKLAFDVSHETVARVLNHCRKTGDLKPDLSWRRSSAPTGIPCSPATFVPLPRSALLRFTSSLLSSWKHGGSSTTTLLKTPTYAFCETSFQNLNTGIREHTLFTTIPGN